MAILRSPLRQPKNETLQIRAEKEIKAKLHKSAEFIDTTPSNLKGEPLGLLFRHDDFERWFGQCSADRNNHKLERIPFSKSVRQT